MNDGSTGPANGWVVMKFGGTSVATAERWDTIETVVKQRMADGFRPLVVCSALSGISNHLEGLLDLVREGGDPGPVLELVRRAHLKLGRDLGLDVEPLLEDLLVELDEQVRGARLIGEVSPRLHARVMSTGELMSTRIGAAWLKSRGLSVAWRDVRDLLPAMRQHGASAETRFLSAVCDDAADPELRAELDAEPAVAVVTQGFIARDEGETVLLGRGGSDTSAALLAARLGAQRLEIWTDVPGLFTANPKDVPTARLIRRVCYEEAESLAGLGGKVLHPRCIAPVRRHRIPLHVKCTGRPELEGTVVSLANAKGPDGVKAVSARQNLVLLVMKRPPTWQSVGFLADVALCFKQHGLSIDLLATSSSSITATLDPAAAPLLEDSLQALLLDLDKVCKAELRRDIGSVSLVGSGIRGVLHELGPGFEQFRDQSIRMVTQAANDLNLTFVMGSDEASAMVRTLHEAIFDDVEEEGVFGPTWTELFPPPPAAEPVQMAGGA